MTTALSPSPRLKNFKTVKQIADSNAAFSEQSIRRLIFDAEKNGLHAHIRRVGRKVIIDEYGFHEWLEQQR